MEKEGVSDIFVHGKGGGGKRLFDINTCPA